MTYDPDGAPRRIVYGDRRSTTANFDYDSRRRLTQYQLGTPFGGSRFSVLPVEHFDYRFSAYDEVGNPLKIEDQHTPLTPGTVLPPEAAPVKLRQMQYDDLYRLTQIDSTYSTANGNAPWRSPLGAEVNAGDNHPVPLRTLPTRVKQQTFDYDGLGNITASSDDLSARYDRSLGSNLGYGTPNDGPNQLRSGEGLQVRYDAAGNLTELKLERPGSCPTGTADQCAQWFAYDWDEVGQLTRARRWDFDGNALPPQATPDTLPTEKPSWDLTYAYSQGMRVRKSVGDAADITKHTLEVFDTLRIEQAPFNSVAGDYQARRYNVHVYPGGMAHAFWDADGTLPYQAPNSAIAMHLTVGDHLGSSSVVINHATSQLVKRTTYQPYGAVESDYRPAKWKSFREPYKFTGKEEDIEVGATYFGARYYQPYLGRFMSADPLTIQGLGSDLNPYAYVGGQVTTQVDPFGLEKDPIDNLPPPGTTIVTSCNPCRDENPPLPADHGMNATRGEAMADFYGNRQLETLSSNGSGSTNSLSRNNSSLLGIPPDGRATDRVIKAPDVWQDPSFKKGFEAVAKPATIAYGAGIAAVSIYAWPHLLSSGGVALYARGGISALALSFYVRGGLFVSGAGAGGIGVAASNGSLGNYGVRTAPIYQGVYNSFRSNPSSIYGLVPKLSLNFINLGVRVPRLLPAVWGKAFELFSVQATPNLVRQLGGAYQPDAIIRVGNQLVNVDWTTWGSLESHLERSYYEAEPFIFYLYQ